MQNIQTRKDNPIDKARTSLAIKIGTRHLLLYRMKPGESFDDVIVRIVNTLDRQEKEVERLQKIIEASGMKMPNRLVESKGERVSDLIELFDGTMLTYGYNLPATSPAGDEYVMDIIIEKVVRKGKKLKFEDLGFARYDRVMLHFDMIERIINANFDSGFRLPAKTMIIDPYFWKQVYSRVGLSERSFLSDILPVIKEFEGNRNE